MTLSELRQAIRLITERNPPEQALAAVVEFFKANQDRFDADAQKEVERMQDQLIAAGTENAQRELPTLGDGPRRRFAARMIALAGKQHFVTHDALAVLANKTGQEAPVIKAVSDAFHRALQTAADFLFDARQDTTRGKRFFVLYGLLYGLVDESLVGFHLAQRAFVTQAFQHIRAVEEVLEVVDLLATDDVLLEQWVAADEPVSEKKLFRTMRKASAKATAQPGREALFAFVSAAGTHPQLRGLQTRASISGRIATLSFLGSRTHIEAANVLVVRETVAFAQKVATVFRERLHPADVEQRLAACNAGLDGLANEYSVRLAAQMRLSEERVHLILHVRP